MKKSIIALMLTGLFATGCATVEEDQIKAAEESMTIDESGFITDEIAIMSITESEYQETLNDVLTEDGYSMRIADVAAEDKDMITVENIIYFGFDSSKISQEMKEKIEKQISFLKKYPKIKVILEGHTDEKGSNAYNVVLGEKRANSVKNILVKSGISASQIEVISYGEMKPLFTGTGEDIWSKNRRVVFVYE